MNTRENHGKSFLSQLSGLEPGESLKESLSRLSYVRSACTTFGMQWSRRFTTSTSREEGTVTVTRVS